MAEVIVMWSGASGKDYKYWVLDADAPLKDGPGNYILAKETSPGRWKAVYVGEANNLKDTLSNPDDLPFIKGEEDIRILAHMSLPNESARKEEESDLIQNLKPPYNQ